MPDPITRRQFLRGSAFLAGAAVVLDPSWLFGQAVAESTGAFTTEGRTRRQHRGSEGLSAQVEYGDGDASPLVRWNRLGEDHTLELWSTSIEIKVPTRSETVMDLPLRDFEEGRGHREVVHFFGAPTLTHLRTEVAHRAVLVQ